MKYLSYLLSSNSWMQGNMMRQISKFQLDLKAKEGISIKSETLIVVGKKSDLRLQDHHIEDVNDDRLFIQIDNILECCL